MGKRLMVAVSLAVALLAPVALPAAGLPGAAVNVVNLLDPTLSATTATDASGAFVVDGLAAGDWRLDVATLAPARTAELVFTIPVEKAPARMRGLVTVRPLADVSLEVNATVSLAGSSLLVLDPGFPALQTTWNLNWAHSNGKLMVRLAGTGLEAVTKIGLSSPTGAIESALLVPNPMGGLMAVFPKAAAFTALAPAGAKRGDTVALQIAVVTASETQLFNRTIRIVGPMGKHGMP